MIELGRRQTIGESAAELLETLRAKRAALQLASPELSIPATPCEFPPHNHGRIELWPTLGRLAIAGGVSPTFRLWCLLAQWSREAGGVPWVEWNKETYQRIGSILHITPRTVKRLGLSGGGGFWEIKQGRLWRFGAWQVYQFLKQAARDRGVAGWDEPNRRKVFIPIGKLASLESFHAACFHAWLCDRRNNEYQATWKVLLPLWKRTRKVLNDWMQLEGITRHENWGERPIGRQRGHNVFDVIADEVTGNPNLVVQKRGQLYLMWQRGNTYAGRLEKARRGAFKRLNVHSVAAPAGESGDTPEMASTPDSGVERWATDRLKANYKDADRFRMAKKLPDVSYVLSKQEVIADSKQVYSRRLWSCEVIGSQILPS